jgi:hypothetical protein
VDRRSCPFISIDLNRNTPAAFGLIIGNIGEVLGREVNQWDEKDMVHEASKE